MRQHRVSLPPSKAKAKSLTTPLSQSGDTPTPLPAPSVQDSTSPSGEDTLKRKPRRPAPVKPGQKQPAKQQPANVSGRENGPIPSESTRRAPIGGVSTTNGHVIKPAATDASRRAPIRSDPAGKLSGVKRPAPPKPPRSEETWRADSSENLLASANLKAVVKENLGASEIPDSASTQGLRDEAGWWSGEPPSSSQQDAGENIHSTKKADSEFPQDEDFDETMFEGGAESVPDTLDDDDFILEPPEDFSESSLGDLDDPNDLADLVTPQESDPVPSGKKQVKKGSDSVTVQFANPTALEMEEEEGTDEGYKPHESPSHPNQQNATSHSYISRSDRANSPSHDLESAAGSDQYEAPSRGHKPAEDPSHRRQHKSTSHGASSTESEASRVKKAKKKKRSSKDYSEHKDGHTHKHKSRKKRKSASSNDLLAGDRDQDIQFPEYEFDRGMDRVPVAAKKERSTKTAISGSQDTGSRQLRQPHQSASNGAESR